jgi:hypothetical protein
MSFGGASGAGVMPCADVATIKAKPATAINLSIVVLPWLYQSIHPAHTDRRAAA